MTQSVANSLLVFICTNNTYHKNRFVLFNLRPTGLMLLKPDPKTETYQKISVSILITALITYLYFYTCGLHP